MTAQRPILTVTLNPALDVSAHADRVVSGPKLRLSGVVTEPGGGGVNVARAVQRLGGDVRALVVLGGATGTRLAELLRGEGLGVIVHPVPGDTRQSLVVTDAAGAQFRFVLPGPEVADESPLISAIAMAAPPGALVVLSGSQPPGISADFPMRLAAALPDRQMIVDTSGAALDHVVTHSTGVSMLRMDEAEAESVAGRALLTSADTADFCESLVRAGSAQMVVAARGAEGSVLANVQGRWHAIPPMVPVISKTGAGDSFTAGFTLALAVGMDPAAALLAGTAAAAAAVMTPGTELCHQSDADRLLAACKIEQI
ncbi:MAG: hexose kinase [Gemmobacter sp.]|nr:hexose kinase [Gemmobacter sp.]